MPGDRATTATRKGTRLARLLGYYGDPESGHASEVPPDKREATSTAVVRPGLKLTS